MNTLTKEIKAEIKKEYKLNEWSVNTSNGCTTQAVFVISKNQEHTEHDIKKMKDMLKKIKTDSFIFVQK